MSATPMTSIQGAKAMINALTALLTATSHLYIRTGALEATSLTADAGTLLATLTMSATAFAAATNVTSDGKATAAANAITSETNAPNGGTAGHFRMKDGSGVVILQGTVGTTLADMIVNTVTVVAGDTFACTSFNVAQQCGDSVS